ncbi:hypothetical protein FACS189449_09490 [Alphaproteobacteria bacterium]|nr:hypothetical protein FACS189449_09490 [Alphaproteobacteria bacterium]
MNLREMVFLSLFSVANILEAENKDAKKPNDDKLLHEIINDKFKEAEIDCPFTISGCLNFTSLYVSQDVKGSNDEAESMLEGDVGLKYCGKVDECSYGFDIGVRTCSAIIKGGSPILRYSSLFLGSEKFGTLKIGYTKTAANLFSICCGDSLVGYGGADSGNLGLFYNESAGSIVDTGFMFNDGRAAKIVYLSPNISGFTFGLSFTPDSRDTALFKTLHPKPGSTEISDERANFPGMRTAYSKNIITAGVAYEFGKSDGFNAKIAAAMWIGKGKSGISDDKKVSNVRAYNIGATIGYEKFKLSLGYTDCGKSLRSQRYATADITTFDESKKYTFGDHEVGLKPGADAGKIYSIGAAYAFDKLTFSAAYFKSIVKFSDTEKSNADIVTLATEYEVNKTISLYAEYDHISTSTCARAQAYGAACKLSTTGINQANVYVIGTKINL